MIEDVSYRVCSHCFCDMGIEPERGEVYQCKRCWGLLCARYAHGDEHPYRFVMLLPETTYLVHGLTRRKRMWLLFAATKTLARVFVVWVVMRTIVPLIALLANFRLYRRIVGGHWELRTSFDSKAPGLRWMRTTYCTKEIGVAQACEGPVPEQSDPPIDAEFDPPCCCGPRDVPCRADCSVCQKGECPMVTR